MTSADGGKQSDEAITWFSQIYPKTKLPDWPQQYKPVLYFLEKNLFENSNDHSYFQPIFFGISFWSIFREISRKK